MTINDAIEILLDIENTEQEGVFLKNTPVVGVARLGSSDQKVFAGTAEQLLAEDFGPPVHSLIIPGKLHFLEEEALENFTVENV
jgi:diphthine synthase